MGCDIHLFTERKVKPGEDWLDMDRYKRNRYFGETGGGDEFVVESILNGRNYALFSMLADVRNYHDNPFIEAPRGLPDDCNKHIKKQSDMWGVDAHSHSYFTLRELIKAREKFRVTNYSGMMSPEDAELVDRGLMPNSWCERTNIKTYVYREWKYESDTLGPLVKNLIKRAKEEVWFRKDENLNDVSDDFRIVFWFDN